MDERQNVNRALNRKKLDVKQQKIAWINDSTQMSCVDMFMAANDVKKKKASALVLVGGAENYFNTIEANIATIKTSFHGPVRAVFGYTDYSTSTIEQLKRKLKDSDVSLVDNPLVIENDVVAIGIDAWPDLLGQKDDIKQLPDELAEAVREIVGSTQLKDIARFCEERNAEMYDKAKETIIGAACSVGDNGRVLVFVHPLPAHGGSHKIAASCSTTLAKCIEQSVRERPRVSFIVCCGAVASEKIETSFLAQAPNLQISVSSKLGTVSYIDT